MPNPLTPRQWAEKAFDPRPNETLFIAVERVIGEAMAQAAADRIEQLEAAMRSIVERCGNSGRGDATVNDRIIERVEEVAVEAIGKP